MPDLPADAAPTGSESTPTAVFQVGVLADGTAVLSAVDVDTWDDAQTPVYLATERAAQARPYAQLQAEQHGRVLTQEPEAYEPPTPGTVRDRVMRDLGWDSETSRRMAEARHAADPERYPTIEAATYTDPVRDGPLAPPPPPRARSARLAETDRMWSEWAANATTDTVPDRYIGEPMPDGTTADRYWWYHPDGALRDRPPDAEDGPGREYGIPD